MKYFLASKSPRRRELLKYLLDDFIAESADIEESLSDGEEIEPQIMSLALQKALALEQKLKAESGIEAGDILIGSDTIVYLDRILGKPKDADEAFHMLSSLSGRVHTVYTSLALIQSSCKKSFVDFTKTEVFFRELSEREILDYIESGDPFDKAGSYGIQGKGARFIERIEGDFYSVMGLPIQLLDRYLRILI